MSSGTVSRKGSISMVNRIPSSWSSTLTPRLPVSQPNAYSRLQSAWQWTTLVIKSIAAILWIIIVLPILFITLFDPFNSLLTDPIAYLKSVYNRYLSCLKEAINSLLTDPIAYLKSVYDGYLSRLEEAWQWSLWILTITAVACVIAFSVLVIISFGLLMSPFTDPIAFFKAIYKNLPGPASPITTSLTDRSAEGVPKTDTHPPVADESPKIYTLPKALHFIASPLDIDDVSTPRRIGYLSEFVQLSDSAGSTFWIGLSSYQSFSPLSSDENPDVLVGSKAYEVIIGQPVKQDDTTSRVEVAPTGRVLGEVVGAYVDNVTVLLKMEDWFTESDIFEMGRWRNVVNERVQAGDEVGMEVAKLG